MRVLFFTDGPLSPGSRFRCLQLFQSFERAGIRCEVQFAYDERYNDVHESPWAPLYKMRGRLARTSKLLFERGHDLIFLHKTTLAFSGLPERLRGLLSTPIIFDFDDAIYLSASGQRSAARERTFRHAVAAAAHVIAGNADLGLHVGAPHKTTVIPTVVDTSRYVPVQKRDSNELIVGWMGTASNFTHLREVIPSLLKALEHVPRARLRIVSNGVLTDYLNHPRIEQWRWNDERELMALQSFDIGLMPLPDTEQARGKCGFKMLQYMSCGVPVLASAVGANVPLFGESRAGQLVRPDGDWCAQLLDLARRSPDERKDMGARGREHIVGRYSVDNVVPRYLELFKDVVGVAQRDLPVAR